MSHRIQFESKIKNFGLQNWNLEGVNCLLFQPFLKLEFCLFFFSNIGKWSSFQTISKVLINSRCRIKCLFGHLIFGFWINLLIMFLVLACSHIVFELRLKTFQSQNENRKWVKWSSFQIICKVWINSAVRITFFKMLDGRDL